MMTRVRDITHKDRRQRTGGVTRTGSTITVNRRFVYLPDDHILTFTTLYLLTGDEYITKVNHTDKVDSVYLKGSIASSSRLHSSYSNILTHAFNLPYKSTLLQYLYSNSSKLTEDDGQLLAYESHKKGVYISYIYRVVGSTVSLLVKVGDVVFNINKTGNGKSLTRIADKLVKLQLSK